jgi:hypothetical protein
MNTQCTWSGADDRDTAPRHARIQQPPGRGGAVRKARPSDTAREGRQALVPRRLGPRRRRARVFRRRGRGEQRQRSWQVSVILATPQAAGMLRAPTSAW